MRFVHDRLYFHYLQYFLEGYCRYEGDLLEHLEGISSIEICQIACSHDAACRYFLYDETTKDCELFDDDTRVCDFRRGPPTPDINECFNETIAKSRKLN